MAIKYPTRTRSDVERQLHHKKGNRTLNGRGVPRNSEGFDGDIRINSVGTGIKLYAKYNGSWYGSKLYPLNSENPINKLSDATGGTIDDSLVDASGGTYPTDEEFVNAVASLAAKINEILDRIG